MMFKTVSTGSKGNSYIIESSTGELLILDCGVAYKRILKACQYRLSDIKAVLISHEHGDHALAFKEFLHSGIPVYGCQELKEALFLKSKESITALSEKARIKAGGFQIVPFYLPHTTRNTDTGEIEKCANFGYLIECDGEKLLYMTDLEYCPYSFRSLQVNHIVCECNYCKTVIDSEAVNYSHQIQGHCSLSTCKGIIRTNKTSKLMNVILVHMSTNACDLDKIRNELSEICGEESRLYLAAADEEIDLKIVPF